MKFRIFFGLVVLVLAAFLFVLCKPEPADIGSNQEPEDEFMKMSGLNWSSEHAKNAMNKFHELRILLEDRFGEEDFQRMGHLLARQGAVIRGKDGDVTGEEKLRLFFEGNAGRSLEISNPRIVRAGAINKIIDGWEVDRWVLMEFEIHLTDPSTLQNQTSEGSVLLFHRNNCPWDG